MSGLHTLGRRRSSAVVGGDAENDVAEHAAVLRALRYGTATYTAPACGASGNTASWLHFMIVVFVLVALYIVECLLKRHARTRKARERRAVDVSEQVIGGIAR